MSTTTTTTISLPATTTDPLKPPPPLDTTTHHLTPPTSTTTTTIRQDPFSLTLTAPSLLALSTLLILATHLLPPPSLTLLLLLTPLSLLIHNDYLNFLRLGPGGTPSTPSGYALLAWYRLFTLRDPFSPPARDPGALPAHGVLCLGGGGSGKAALPYRPGPRPNVAGLAPQRQLDQHGSFVADRRLRAALRGLCARDPERFGTATSCLEKHGLALFARHPRGDGAGGGGGKRGRGAGNRGSGCVGEICHIHATDRSLHLSLHPDDIREVLEKRWGERHPMAWEWPVRSPVPTTFTMIYAPRDESDLRIVCRIIEAAIWYTLSEHVEIPLPPELMA
ncbi:hypothetical protein C8A05DRAFT_16821 [Staphylotrichum tortipilum]|uniref:Luciferase domain-containing protein n=1 Tax=Staphylotrichum tortipilum TaxID=2831512 RepID=A0AAN6MHF8_9PEZI|nr:hypothetical protein C8A05DRAFT_16821 [Staphylotrichum longicolle]